ncbi:hypothetical protein ACFP81_13350 [Deinococcus lacus]|uniref:Uncharacterized protein n=1 Tax=Deinococcus lacus TaxID=392561 RepID=A0ABW1YEY4_9DEIO
MNARAVAGAALLGVWVALCFWLLQARPAPAFVPVSQAGCVAAPFQFGLPQTGAQAGERFVLTTNTWLEATVCSPGTLSLQAAPEMKAAGPPNLQVQLDHEVLYAGALPAPRTLSVPVPRAGRISVNYLNDQTLLERRTLTLRALEVSGCPASALDPQVLEGSGGWYPSSGSLSLFLAPGAELTVCAAGTLSLTVQGEAGRGEWPVVALRQGSRELARVTATADPQTLQLPVEAGTVQVVPLNPLFETRSDRNLVVLPRFVPQP